MSELTNYNAAIYVRLSKEDEDASDGRKNESNSITNQKQLILDYLQDKPEINIVSVRIDDGYTGTNYDRPAFQLMMNDIKAGTVNCPASAESTSMPESISTVFFLFTAYA